MLPNFLVVGAQKSGTTSLHHYLINHPDIYLPDMKETKFFVSDAQYEKGIEYYQDEYFSSAKNKKAIGEIDPDYMYIPRALDRVREHLDMSNLKIIFLLRNPIDRAFSHYLMTYRRGLELLSFEEGLEKEAERIQKGQSSGLYYSYATRGFYYKQISRFLKYVDSKHMLFLLSEDLKDKPEETIQSIYEFLGVAVGLIPDNLGEQYHKATIPKNISLLHRIKQHDGIEKRILRILIPWEKLRHKLRHAILDWNQVELQETTITPAVRNILIEKYREDNRLLSEFLGRDLSYWLQ